MSNMYCKQASWEVALLASSCWVLVLIAISDVVKRI